MMKKYIFLLFIFCASVSWAQITTIKVNPTETFSSTNGVVYALPQVSFRVDVWVEKTEQLKGPYAAFANKLLGLDRIIDMNASDYKIKSIKLSAEYAPDPTQLYFLQIGEISAKSEYSNFLNMEATGLFGGFSAGKNSVITTENESLVEQLVKGDRAFRYYADANLVEKVDTIIRRVDIDTATIEKATIKRYSVEKDNLQRAQDAATYLMEIRKNRFELISGYNEVAYSPGALELMNNELKQLENDYLALFAGKTLLTDEHYVFYVTPTSDQPNIIEPVFKFSEQNGLTYLSNAGGEKVSLAIKSNGLAENLADVSVSGTVNGVVYRFPETAEVWVKYGNKEYAKQLMQIPQFGKLQKLQINQNSFELHPTTGGLKMLEIKK